MDKEKTSKTIVEPSFNKYCISNPLDCPENNIMLKHRA